MSDAPTASQTVGPFFSIGLTALCRENIACSAAAGTPVTIRGRVLEGDGQPVPDAVLEVWQASEAGLRGEEKSPNGFARIATNERSNRRQDARRMEPCMRRTFQWLFSCAGYCGT